MKMIVAVDSQWAIGYKGKLLDHIPEDLKKFKEITSGKTVIMGRKTLESLPGGKPLPNRVNVVLTRDKNYSKKGVIVVNDIKTILDEYSNDDCYIVGGSELYSQLLNHCNTVYVTKIYYKYKNVDRFFPNLDNAIRWECKILDKLKVPFGKDYINRITFNKYTRR